MKKEYNSPEFEFLKITFIKDVLGDSLIDDGSGNPNEHIYNPDPGPGDDF